MAAGDIALGLLISATDLASTVVLDMAGTYDTSMMTMGDSTVVLNDYLVALGDQVFTTGAGFDGMAASADATAASLDAVGVSADVTMVATNALTDSLSAQDAALASTAVASDEAATGFDVLAASADGAKAALSFVATALAATAVVASVVGVVSAKMAGDFQQNITKLYTTAGEFKGNLQMVGDGILNMSASVGTGALKLSEAMYWIESGGLHGALGLEALRVAAQAAKAENANLDKVSIALAASLNAYQGKGMTTVQVMNTLTAATGQGMMTFEQLSGSLASVLPAAAKFGVSLNNVTAALATMTAQGDPADQAATHLKQVILALEAPSKIGAASLKSVGLTSQEVANEMKISLPGALQMITDAVGKKFPEGSAAYNQAIKNIAGGSKQMMGFLELTGQHMGTFAANVGKISSAVKSGGNDLMGWADIQQNFNFKLDQAKAAAEALFIKIGTALLPILGSLLDKVTPAISAFGDWLGKSNALQNGLNFLGGIIQSVVGYLKSDAFAGVIADFQTLGYQAGKILAPALQNVGRFAVSAFASIGPLLTNVVIPAIDTVAFYVGLFLMAVNQGDAKISPFLGILFQIGHVFQQIGGFLISTFTPVWKQLQQAFGDLQTAIKPIMPQLTQFAQFLGGVLGVAIVLAIAIIAGLIGAFAGLLKGAIQVFTGIVQFISGAISVVSGIISLFIDLATGKWGNLAADLNQIMGGLVRMFIGVWNMIAGIFSAAFGIISGFASGFSSAIIGIFQDLSNALWGHSIIPNMITGIVSWFASLPGKALTAISSLPGKLSGFFSGLATTAISWGSNILKNLATGIQNGISFVSGAIGNVTQFIADHLPHSPVKMGPLRDLERSGSQIIEQLSRGMLSAMPKMQATMNMLPTPGNFASSGGSRAGNAFALSGSQTIIVQVQPATADITMDHRKVGEGVMRYASKEIRIQGNIKNK